jgi:hypothetical protein
VLPACLLIWRELARCLVLPEPRPWNPSRPKRLSDGINDDVGSDSEPEAPTGGLDPLDPELIFHHHHFSAWRLWAAWMECRHATERASRPTTSTAQPTGTESLCSPSAISSSVVSPAQTIHGC